MINHRSSERIAIPFLTLLGFVLLCLSSCKKGPAEPDGGSNPAPNPVGDMPGSFTARVLVEHFTGEWNPNCPTGDDSLRAMQRLDSNRVVAVSVHQGDTWALTSFFNALSPHLGGVGGFPRAAFNRLPALYGTQTDSTVISIFNWRANLLPMLSAPNVLQGLALDTYTGGDTLRVRVYAGSQDSLPEAVRLTVYVTEDSLAAVNQAGAAPGYLHHRVLRRVLSASLGDTLTLPKGVPVMREYLGSLGNLAATKGRCRIIAFLHIYSTDPKLLKVLNVREAKLKEIKKWD